MGKWFELLFLLSIIKHLATFLVNKSVLVIFFSYCYNKDQELKSSTRAESVEPSVVGKANLCYVRSHTDQYYQCSNGEAETRSNSSEVRRLSQKGRDHQGSFSWKSRLYRDRSGSYNQKRSHLESKRPNTVLTADDLVLSSSHHSGIRSPLTSLKSFFRTKDRMGAKKEL